MSRNNRNIIGIVVILAIAVVLVVDRGAVLTMLSQVLYIVQVVFFVTATLWLWKHW